VLSIRNLHVTVAGKEILRGLSLEVAAGEVHAIRVVPQVQARADRHLQGATGRP